MGKLMKVKSGVAVIFGAALLMGLLISVQAGSMQGSESGGLVLATKLNVYEDELKKIQEEKKTANQMLLDYEGKIAEIENAQAADNAYLKELVASVERYKMEAGVVDVEGPGFIVTIKEPVTDDGDHLGYDENGIIYTLIQLVNKLKSGGAEAVAINGQRILATTDISFMGDNVEINSIPIAPPYTVQAIGNPSRLEYILNLKYGILEQIRNEYSFRISIKKYDELTIPRYAEEIKYRYAKPEEKS